MDKEELLFMDKEDGEVVEQKGPCKLFVGHLPNTVHEHELRIMFEKFGEIEEISVLYEKVTGDHKGCGFVTFAERSDAVRAMEALNGKKTLPKMKSPIQVKFAGKESQKRLFVGLIPKSIQESQLKNLMESFGTVEHVFIMKNNDGSSKGCGFVTFSEGAAAKEATKALNKKYCFPKSSQCIIVRPAESEKQKVDRKVQQQLQSMQSQYLEYVNQINSYSTVQAIYSQAIAQTMYTNQATPPVYRPSFADLQRRELEVPKKSREGIIACVLLSYLGPEGCNLFVYGLPPTYVENDLLSLFSSFGSLINAKVCIDPVTRKSKGYGFVSYSNPSAAVLAIQQMNGFQLLDKKLKVSVRRNDQKPY